MCRGLWASHGERGYVKPLDSNDGALVAATSESDEGANARRAAFVPDPADAEVPTPRARSEVVPAPGASASAFEGSRVSRIVPRGTTEDEAADDVDAARPEPIAARASVAVLAATSAATPLPAPVQAVVSVPALRESDVAPRNPRGHGSSPVPPEVRAAARFADFAATRIGPGIDAEPDDEEEATTVDAGASLTDEDREALARHRNHSTMEQTLPIGTPPPAPVQGVGEGFAEAARDRRNAFKQTMLLGLPRPEAAAMRGASVGSAAATGAPSPEPTAESLAEQPPVAASSSAGAPAAAAAPAESLDEPAPVGQASAPRVLEVAPSAEPALMASVVRVVGPPTQPPPRRSRRIGGIASPEPSEPSGPSEPDHEAFVLTNPIPPDASRRSAVPPSRVPIDVRGDGLPPLRMPSSVRGDGLPASRTPSRGDAPPAGAANRFAVAASRASLPGVMLPPAPTQRDYEPASSPSTVPPAPLLRATIEPPMSSLSRTRPPQSQRTVVSDAGLGELPGVADPFAGFVAPAPSVAQRWLVVVVVALAVVGLCSLAAIALGLLGKTGW